MYFNHAFRKTFLIADNGTTISRLGGGDSTTDLTAGQIGLFDEKLTNHLLMRTMVSRLSLLRVLTLQVTRLPPTSVVIKSL